MNKKILFLIFFAALAALTGAQTLPIERYALYIAANNGGQERELLRYAISDASRFAGTLFEIGGVKPENSIILAEPARSDIERAFDALSRRIEQNKNRARRTEFILYYSGHSDEKAILLGGERFTYTDLKSRLAAVPSDVHIVMLDSCFSGNFIRTKGGTVEKPFLMDDSTIVQGHAYLSSSSEKEPSQESDTIEASFFTQALITGLRGAADSSGDGKVSLNELYHYAFNDTLSKTEQSSHGPQHPSYNITLVGSGDLILTDLSESEAAIVLPKQDEGRYFIRTASGQLVSELGKTPGTELFLALPTGIYTITRIQGADTAQTVITLSKDERIYVGSGSFSRVNRLPARQRGETETAQVQMQQESPVRDTVPVSVSVLSQVMYPGTSDDIVNISASPFMSQNWGITGIQASGFSAATTGFLDGVQVAGFMASARGRFNGIQAAGFMGTISPEGTGQGMQFTGFMSNLGGSFSGIQASGFMNISSGTLSGVQGAGFLNIATGRIEWLQASGFLNIAGDGFSGVQGAGFANITGGDSDGVQASGFINIAGKITGMQIGVINIARSNSGLSLGILNFIADGIIAPSISMEDTNTLFFAYHGGTPSFFTSFHLGFEQTDDPGYGVLGFGIGRRLFASHRLAVDLELIGRLFIPDEAGLMFSDKFEEIEQTQDEQEQQNLAESVFEDGMDYWVPHLRITAIHMFKKHFGAFASIGLDFNLPGQNDKAFEVGNRNKPLTASSADVVIYPVFSAGLRF